MTIAIGLNISRTAMSVVAVSGKGERLFFIEAATPQTADDESTFDAIRDQTVDMVVQTAAEAGFAPDKYAVGVGVSGIVTPDQDVYSIYLNCMNGRNLRNDLCDELKTDQIVLLNDAKAFGFYETRFGALSGRRDGMALIFDQGAGGGYFKDGEIIVGEKGLHGEVGLHQCHPIEGGDKLLELRPDRREFYVEYLSVGDLLTTWGVLNYQKVVFSDKNLKPKSIEELCRCMKEGEKEEKEYARHYLKAYFAAAARAFVPLIIAHNPPLFVVEGCVTKLPGFHKEIMSGVKRLSPEGLYDISIVPSSFGKESSARGAAAWAQSKFAGPGRT